MENRSVILKEEDGKDILEFHLKNNIDQIDLNTENQSYLRDLFYQIIKEAMHEPFSFNLTIQEGYSKGLYKEIAEAYIKQLNSELGEIIQSLPDELKGIDNHD